MVVVWLENSGKGYIMDIESFTGAVVDVIKENGSMEDSMAMVLRMMRMARSRKKESGMMEGMLEKQDELYFYGGYSLDKKIFSLMVYSINIRWSFDSICKINNDLYYWKDFNYLDKYANVIFKL